MISPYGLLLIKHYIWNLHLLQVRRSVTKNKHKETSHVSQTHLRLLSKIKNLYRTVRQSFKGFMSWEKNVIRTVTRNLGVVYS